MTFEEDLTKRRINVAAFAAGDPERYAAWRSLYEQVHPNTFYTSVKMVINDVRRRFWLEEVPKPAAAPTPAAKPVMRRATGTVPSTASAIPDEPSPTVDRTPEPAPRTRPVIRRPSVTETAAPEEKESIEEKPLASETEGAPLEMPKPGRARPVFRRPAAETPANASAENETVPEDKPAVAPETASPSTDAAKPPRPRPVFKKPATSETKAAEANTTSEAPTEASTTSLPEHSNPEPDATPKPPRPRPVFKRPTPATPAETEKTAALPESSVPIENPADSRENIIEEESADVTPAGPKPPRPRPIFKRPVPATSAESNKEIGTSPAGEIENKPADSLIAKPIEITPEPVKPLRPRPIFKRPGTATPGQNPAEITPEPAAENNSENNPESAPMPEAPTFLRPRPIMKRPV
ncbi:MAG: hypothetical protein M3142_04610, partial [Bacteroidota bacterium]|nr:hypothetical protein [Bacteroidota bacterium]